MMTAEERDILRQKVDAGIKAAIAAELEEHRLLGRKVAIWRDGRVQLVVPPPQAEISGTPVLREDSPAD